MKPAPKSTAETTTLSATAVWSVQVNAFAREENARSLVKRIKNKGYDAFVDSPKIDGRTWYRVRVGQFATQKEAKQLLLTLIEKEKYSKAIIARSDIYTRIAVPQ
jgi:cell division septation protein DedD